MTGRIVLPDTEPERPPEPPPHGPVVWARENLFSSVASGILTVVVGTLVVLFLVGVLGFVFGEDRRWDAVFFNTQLMMTQAYPDDQYFRVWLSLGTIISLTGLSLAVWQVGGRVSLNKITRLVTSIGAALIVLEVLGPFSIRAKVVGILIGLVLVGGAYLVKRAAGERAKQETIPLMAIVGIIPALGVVALYVLRIPTRLAEENYAEQVLAPIADTTRIPITVLFIVGVVAYLVGVAIRDRVPNSVARLALVGLWVLSLPVIVLTILRDPELDYDKILAIPGFQEGYLWWAVIFAVGGSLLITYLGSPARGEEGRLVGGLLVIVALASWGVSMLVLIRLLLLFLATFALAAPTFGGGEGRARARIIGLWVITVVAAAYFIVLVSGPSTVQVQTTFFIGGLFLSFILAIFGITLSFPLGVLFALGRTSSMPIFRLMSVFYIEVVRGVPFITWLLTAIIVFPIFLPLGVQVSNVVAVLVMTVLFSAAYLAENVRGGLQSVSGGQVEAAKALGMTTAQTTVFIILPQALRAVIPAMVGQFIGMFKDTSLVIIVGLFDFLAIARNVIPNQRVPFNNLDALTEPLMYAALVYWIFTYSFSRASQRLEKKLGVGER